MLRDCNRSGTSQDLRFFSWSDPNKLFDDESVDTTYQLNKPSDLNPKHALLDDSAHQNRSGSIAALCMTSQTCCILSLEVPLDLQDNVTELSLSASAKAVEATAEEPAIAPSEVDAPSAIIDLMTISANAPPPPSILQILQHPQVRSLDSYARVANLSDL